jgi:hypothetical protein
VNDRTIITDIVTGDIDIDELHDRILEIFMGEIKTEIQKNSPVDTGYMRGHWSEQLSGRHQIVYSNDTKYLPFHITGTGLYGPKHQMICAKGMSKRNPQYPHVMAWRPAGKQTGPLTFRRCIKGMKKNDFVLTSIDNGIQNAIEALTQMVQGADHVIG